MAGLDQSSGTLNFPTSIFLTYCHGARRTGYQARLQLQERIRFARSGRTDEIYSSILARRRFHRGGLGVTIRAEHERERPTHGGPLGYLLIYGRIALALSS